MHEVHRARLNDEGRLVIPAGLRKALGLRPGQEVLLRRTDTGLELTTFDAAVKQFQDRVAGLVPAGTSLVTELIAERRAEAAREADE
jgi:AbrB family looped-hinge helix DNA binding protein